MVTTTLADTSIRAGEDLLRLLDEDGIKVDAALWLFFAESGTWRLVIASPDVDSNASMEPYRRVQALLDRVEDGGLTLLNVSLVSPRSPLIQHRKNGARQGQVTDNMRLFRGAVDGHFIDDAYIYRVRP